jgi:cobalt-zinc-cadmium resistance protein CzcA
VEEKEGFIISRAKSAYAPLLKLGFRVPLTIAGCAAALFAVAILLFSTMGQEFIPTLDEKDIAMHAMRIPSTSLTQSQELQSSVEKTLSAIPEVAFVYSKTGTAEMAADPMPPNVSDTFIILKPQKEWPDPNLPKPELIERIQAEVGKVPGNNYEFTQPIQMRFNELISGVRSDVAVKLYGDDFATMEKTSNQIAQVLREIDGAADVKVEQTSGLPMLEIKLEKPAIARYGLNVSDVLDVIAVAIGGRETGLVFQGDRRFDIIVRLPDELRQDMDVIQNLPILLPEDNDPSDQISIGQHSRPSYIPLKEVATLEIKDGPNQISRENGKRRMVIQSNVRGRDISSFVTEAQTKIDSTVKVPAGYWVEWGGQFENLKAAKARLMIVVPACFFMIFLLLFAALSSIRQALLVFSGIPLAVFGGVATLWIMQMPFSVSAAVGFIALSGISVLNGLVMITSINQHVLSGLPTKQAVFEGALSKLRPMLTAAIVPSLGYVPMALSTGAGAEVQKPLALVVIGGLITATILTLLVLPAIYNRFNLGEDVLPKGEM